jgi:hypothetical protein
MVTAACQTIAALEHADASLAAGTETLATAKPALPLLGRLLGLQSAERRNDTFSTPRSVAARLLAADQSPGVPRQPFLPVATIIFAGRRQVNRCSHLMVSGRCDAQIWPTLVASSFPEKRL